MSRRRGHSSLEIRLTSPVLWTGILRMAVRRVRHLRRMVLEEETGVPTRIRMKMRIKRRTERREMPVERRDVRDAPVRMMRRLLLRRRRSLKLRLLA